MSDFDFNIDDYEASESFDLLPNGWYAATIIESEMKPTKAGPEQLAITFEMDANKHPEAANRRVWDSLNINNASEKARDIARSHLKALCLAAGLQVQNASDLLGAQLLVRVGVQPARDGYEARNTVKGYKPLGGGENASLQPKAGSSTPAAKPKTPWGK
jgi:hypothetical protein